MRHDFHPYAWTLWLAAGMTAVLLTDNPLYLIITLLSLGFLFATLHRRHQASPAPQTTPRMTWGWLVRLALILWAFGILFNGLTVHAGDHILFTLPASWPIIGGPITLEAIIYGFLTGLNLILLILLFAIYNSVLGPQTILRMVPGFAYQLGVAISIAISFVPQTFIAWQDIREAQRLRGYRARGLREILPLFISLLGYGLDRAIQLAESMEARGFGGQMAPATPRQTWIIRGSIVGGLVALLIGLGLRSFYPKAWLGWAWLVGGMILVGVGLIITGRRVHRSRYRRWLWRPRDIILMVGSGLLLGIILLLAWLSPRTLFYYPYPPYDILPPFQPLLALIFMLPMLPAWLLPPPPSSTP